MMSPNIRQKQTSQSKKDQNVRQNKSLNLYQNKNKVTHTKTTSKSKSSRDLTDIGLTYPSTDTAFKILLLVRSIPSFWCHVTDCDETYNYWEPSHFLLYGTGQQTWEYSPQYALRSYLYLLVHMVPAKICSYITETNPVNVFYFIRLLLATGCAISEVYLYKNVCREFGVHIARLMLAFMIFSSGMFISSAAFLPSSFSMYLSTTAIAAWYGRKYELAIFTSAISALLGWPFAALISAPIAIDLLFRRKEWFRFIKWSFISAAVILIPMICTDSMYYGKLVIAPLNIIMYNVFTQHGANIYGTESFSFYFVNGFLNFNVVFIGALLTPIALILGWIFVPANTRHPQCLPYLYSLSPFYLWYTLMTLLSHKEERFLFPVYPLICLNGAITVDMVQKLFFFIRTKISSIPITTHYVKFTTPLMVSAIVISGFFGISRSYALYRGYYAPMQVMNEANKYGVTNKIPTDIDINFCVGKEWHRFPSSFFFPSSNWRLQYLKSEFKGQLPQPYLDNENATSIIQPHFNDLNKEEVSRYFEAEKCHFLLDLDTGSQTELEPNYSRQTDRFTVVSSAKFLLAQKSHPLFRAFYFPWSESCVYGNYNLLKNTKFKQMITAKKNKMA